MAELKERTIEKEFVPYDLALELKDLDFDEECFGFYTEEYKKLIKNFCKCPINLPTKPFLAPTFSQAFRFFREKYMLSGEIYIFKNIWNFDIEDISNSIQLYTSDIMCYNSYEEAEVECLVKLIEIAKEQNVK